MRTIDVCDEQIDQLVIGELKFAYQINAGYSDQHSKDIVAATERLLQYYMTPDQHEKWLAER